jgi:hypothetical protein
MEIAGALRKGTLLRDLSLAEHELYSASTTTKLITRFSIESH